MQTMPHIRTFSKNEQLIIDICELDIYTIKMIYNNTVKRRSMLHCAYHNILDQNIPQEDKERKEVFIEYTRASELISLIEQEKYLFL